MCTLHQRSQLLQRAKLQLLHRSFALSELLRDFPNTPLLDETLKYHVSLLRRKLFNQSKQPCSSLSSLVLRSGAQLRWVIDIHRLARRVFQLIKNRVRRNTKEPSGERSPRPCITFQVSKRLVKNLRSQIFRFIAIAHSSRN